MCFFNLLSVVTDDFKPGLEMSTCLDSMNVNQNLILIVLDKSSD